MTLRLAVTGLKGQVARALIERAPRDVEIVALGRPQLALGRRNATLASLRHARCDAIINAAAYTAVDKAESEPDLAMRINGEGAGHVAEVAAALGAPLLHISTDYVFDGRLARPYREEDRPQPLCAYGRSRLMGEARIAARCRNSVILRTSRIFSPYAGNFIETMLRLADTREDIGVVADQTGNPTSALDIADALFCIARRLAADPSPRLRGVFHLTGEGAASWAEMAEESCAALRSRGRRASRVRHIATADYPAAAPRPANSRLCTAKLQARYGMTLPPWRDSFRVCVPRMLED